MADPLAPLIAPASAVLVTIETTCFGQVYETTHGYVSIDPVVLSPAVLAAFLASFGAVVPSAYLACLSLDSYSGQTRVADVSGGTVPTLVGGTTGVQGTEVTRAIPTVVAAILTRQSALKGRRGRGRFFMPAVPQTFVTPTVEPNRLNAHGVALYVALQTALAGPFLAGGSSWFPAVLSRPILPATLVTRGARLVSTSVVSLLGTSRRRREGRGS